MADKFAVTLNTKSWYSHEKGEIEPFGETVGAIGLMKLRNIGGNARLRFFFVSCHGEN